MTVSDFKFTPSTITIHTGDTVTWTNDGPSDHTVTARDGSFDLGVLKKGQSGSHMFTRPGTFAYFCRIHPFMHGTIVVQPVAATTTNASASAPSRGTPGGSGGKSAHNARAAGGPSLPLTGLNLITMVVIGLVLTLAGAGVRWALHR